MSTLSLVPTSTETRVGIEPSAGDPLVCIDLQSVAGLIDVVAGCDPVRLSTLFTMLSETSFKSDTRILLGTAVACRDPLSDLGTIYKDALRTFADLEKLARAQSWRDLAGVVGHHDPRACALLNACDHEIARLQGPKQRRLKTIRSRLEAAAWHERTARGQEMQAIAALRQARCPKIWKMYERWRDAE